jgi:hypothetical protein
MRVSLLRAVCTSCIGREGGANQANREARLGMAGRQALILPLAVATHTEARAIVEGTASKGEFDADSGGKQAEVEPRVPLEGGRKTLIGTVGDPITQWHATL